MNTVTAGARAVGRGPINVFASFFAVIGLGLLAFVLTEVAGLDALFGLVVPYLAGLIFIGGILHRVVKWARSPVPFRITTTCGQQKTLPWIRSSCLDNPHNRLGVIGRMALEVLFFRSLLRNTNTELRAGPRVVYGSARLLWLCGLAFHWTFLVILLRHLRYFTEPVPGFVHTLGSIDGFMQVGFPVIFASTFVFLGALTYLLARRLLSPPLRYVSLAGDYFPLFLLLGIGGSGVLLQQVVRTPIDSVKELAMGLVSFHPVVPSGIHGLFYVHLFWVSVLLAYFPSSKLVHMAGIFLSPTRNLANNNRAERHVNPWDYPVKVHSYEAYEDEFREKMKQAGIPVEKE